MDLKEVLPQTFGYQSVGVLFKEDMTGNLYWIEGANVKKINLSKENIVELPVNLGLTGIAIENRKTMLFEKGNYDSRYVADIDNVNSLQSVQNVLICPFFNAEG